MIIYKITNKYDGKIYIGQTVRTLEERMGEHKRKKQTYFDKHYKNTNDFIVEIIDYANSIEELNEKEKYYISKFNSIFPNGYNYCEGGDNTTGFRHSEESKRKMSEHKKGRYCGEENHYFGKHHTEETKQKMREAWKTGIKK